MSACRLHVPARHRIGACHFENRLSKSSFFIKWQPWKWPQRVSSCSAAAKQHEHSSSDAGCSVRDFASINEAKLLVSDVSVPSNAQFYNSSTPVCQHMTSGPLRRQCYPITVVICWASTDCTFYSLDLQTDLTARDGQRGSTGTSLHGQR